LQPVLRCLGDQVVVNTVFPVHEEHGSYLETATQRVQHTGSRGQVSAIIRLLNRVVHNIS
jgi:hypothetical protein